MMVFISNGKTTYFAKRVLYKTLLARKLSKPEDGRYRPKHVVFPLLINTII